jgi:membrane protease YdiL (CAAX protease family)
MIRKSLLIIVLCVFMAIRIYDCIDRNKVGFRIEYLYQAVYETVFVLFIPILFSFYCQKQIGKKHSLLLTSTITTLIFASLIRLFSFIKSKIFNEINCKENLYLIIILGIIIFFFEPIYSKKMRKKIR